MTSKHVLKLSSINAFLENDNKVFKKGENALESNHVKKMEFDSDFLTIRGEILASMKNKSYKVSIVMILLCQFCNILNNSLLIFLELEKSGEISSATCNCPKGIKCHHIAALALFGHYNISITDKACSWNAPMKSKCEWVKSAEELYPPNPYNALEDEILEESVNKLNEKLGALGNTVGFTWLLNEESVSTINNFPVIEEIIPSKEFLEVADKVSVFKQKCAVDDHVIQDTAHVTIGQVSTDKWYLVRKFVCLLATLDYFISHQEKPVPRFFIQDTVR